MGDTLSEPQTMQVLLQELGVPDAAILREDASMISGANAQRAAALLRPRGVDTVILVTCALHMRRALAMWIRRVIAQRLPPEAKLPPVTELAEVQAMLSRNVIRWDVRAMEKGRQEGRLEGRIELARSTLERQLTRRFGALPPEAEDRIHRATLPQLETWLDRIIDAPTWQAVFGAH
jgi:hypothetical protein